MDHEESHCRPRHDPQPLQENVEAVAGLVDVVDGGLSGCLADHFVVGLDRGTSPIDDLLDGAQADTESKHRSAEDLNR
nr:hypothetical protein [Desulfatiglans anilini]